jgi:hypothetical protein
MGPRARAVRDQVAASASKDFGKEVLAALRKRGIKIQGSTWLPGPGGDFANGERGYLLDDNGTGRVRDYRGVLVIAGYG